MQPRIAIISFPGNNGDTENLRCFWRNGFDAFVFRWNDDRRKLTSELSAEGSLPRASAESARRGVDGYFIGAGFSFEDRGRAGMIAARDPLFNFLHEESEKGKVIVGHCNGCQMLVESGLIPLGNGLRMCVARNAIRESSVDSASSEPVLSAAERSRRAQHDTPWKAPGFLNEWIWMKASCKRDRCCASDWVDSTGSPLKNVMHIPIAHGEGRFVTKDPDLIAALEENDQIAFRYCDADGNVSEDPSVTLNGSTGAIAGICNPAGNVVAMMPHAERTVNGDPYFQSIRRWMEQKRCHGERSRTMTHSVTSLGSARDDNTWDDTTLRIEERPSKPLEIFIDTIIVNNEERTVEQAARKITPDLRLKQFRYLSPTDQVPEQIVHTIALFNPNKERAYVRKEGEWKQWNAVTKQFQETDSPLQSTTLLRRDEPDVSASHLSKGSQTGVCYSFDGVKEINPKLQEIFANPHASILEKMVD